MKFLKMTRNELYIPIDGLSIEIFYDFSKESGFQACHITIRKTVSIICPNKTQEKRKKGWSHHNFEKVCFDIHMSDHKAFLKGKDWETVLMNKGKKIFEDFLKSDEKLLHFEEKLQKAVISLQEVED